MSTPRTHHVTTSDGVTLGGTVHGDGPALVLLQGVIGDGDLDWRRVVGHLTARFTCHVPNLRGRGLSSDHPDLSPSRLIADVVAYVDSLDEPTALTGWSGGGSWSLAAAAESDTVSAVAPYEPGVLSLMDEQERMVIGHAVARAGELAGMGSLAAAARAFAGFPFDDAGIAEAEANGYFEAAGRYVPDLLRLLGQAMESEDPTADPQVLGAISAPVTVLVGSATKPFFRTSARYVVDHVPGAQMREIAGPGHAAPLTHPEALAEALIGSLAEAQQPA